MKRLFSAIELHPDKAFTDTLSRLQVRLTHERISWVSGHNLHLTLKFFGETNEEKIPEIIEAMQLGVKGVPVFDLRFNRIGIFGSSYNPKVIWLGADINPALNQLFEQLKTELEKSGFVYDRQNFVPHLTLGRIRSISDKALFQQLMDEYREAFSFGQKTGSLQLYESVLTPKGPIYTTLYTAALQQQ
jgi:RNA 2',3'-cyclic 3'-phosphodiesterase